MSICPHTIWYDIADSTNNAARKLLESGENIDIMSVVAARKQTCGRGQGNHSWTSEPGQNLTFSIAVSGKYCKKLKSLSDINAWICPVLCEFLEEVGIHPRVKLPNDICVEDRKICGILVENSFLQGRINATIIGVGLNLNQTEWPDNLPNPVSLKELTGKNYKPEDVLSELVNKFCKKNFGKDF